MTVSMVGLIVTLNLAQCVAFPIQSLFFRRKLSMVVPAYMKPWDTSVAWCSRKLRRARAASRG